MDVRFAEVELERLFYIQSFTAGYDDAVVRGYREAVQIIAAARDVQDLCNWQSLRFVAPPDAGCRPWALQLPGAWRLVLQPTGDTETPGIVVVAIEDSVPLPAQGKP